MSHIFEPTAADRELYETTLRNFLPERFIDFHSHLSPAHTLSAPTPERLKRYWPLHLPTAQSADEFLGAYDRLFPGKAVRAAAFAMPMLESDIPAQNAYVIESARRLPQVIPFCVARPDDTEAQIEEAVAQGFVGLKPYPDLADTSHPGEEAIEEFLTPAMCSVADRHRLPVIVHIARAERLASASNIEELLRVTDRWPNIRLIIAHFGRSYTPLYLEQGLKLLNGACPWWYDFAAVTNPEVFELALEAIPHDRICFGLDNPIMLSRGYYSFPAPDKYAVHIQGYNLDDATQPPLAYQIVLGFKKAAEKYQLSRESLDRIFYRNAEDVLGGNAEPLE